LLGPRAWSDAWYKALHNGAVSPDINNNRGMPTMIIKKARKAIPIAFRTPIKEKEEKGNF